MREQDHHLDLGCGETPRNPYARAQLHGVDIRAFAGSPGFESRSANLMLEPIPYPDSTFASVSAFNFIEHVPRVMPTADGRSTRFPFIELMQDVWRVLQPGGLFYAVTPAFPHAEAFADPTHVNIVTDTTHEYFCGERPLGHMYGFSGCFEAMRIEWTHFADALTATPGREGRRPVSGARRIAHAVRGGVRRLRGRPAQGRQGFLIWELRAVKPSTGQA